MADKRRPSVFVEMLCIVKKNNQTHIISFVIAGGCFYQPGAPTRLSYPPFFLVGRGRFELPTARFPESNHPKKQNQPIFGGKDF
ncbi:MAG: hypothetical protein AABW85_03710 [archaeon]